MSDQPTIDPKAIRDLEHLLRGTCSQLREALPLLRRLEKPQPDEHRAYPQPEILTLAEASKYVRMSRRSLQRAVHAGNLTVSFDVKTGKGWRFRRRDLDAWLDRRSRA